MGNETILFEDGTFYQQFNIGIPKFLKPSRKKYTKLYTKTYHSYKKNPKNKPTSKLITTKQRKPKHLNPSLNQNVLIPKLLSKTLLVTNATRKGIYSNIVSSTKKFKNYIQNKKLFPNQKLSYKTYLVLVLILTLFMITKMKNLYKQMNFKPLQKKSTCLQNTNKPYLITSNG